MNRSLLLIAASLVVTQFAAAQTVATDPVGFTTTTVAAGKIGALSFPLHNPPSFVGPATTVGNSTIQTPNAGWATNAYGPFGGNPHVIRVLSGTSEGRQFRITSHTADTLTVANGGVNLATVIANGDRYEILRVNTLASLFGATAPNLNRNSDPAQADNVLIRGTSGYLTYYNDGVSWLLVGGDGETAEDHTPLMPEAGLLFVRRGTTPYAFTVAGAVPMTKLKTDLPANKITLLGNRFPTANTLEGLGLQALQGWNFSADPNAADNVLIRGTSGWLTYYHDQTSWLLVGGDGETAENPPIGTGTSLLVVRKGGANLTLDQAKPY